ncbi:MAG: hypothetical protein WC265_00605 [Dysgonamonadaceae bacterium]|jgi:hypothetical protein
MNALEKIKSELLRLELGKDIQESWNILLAYFNNSSHLIKIDQNKRMLVDGYVDPEEDEKHKYHTYIVKGMDILVKITAYDFRRIIVSNAGNNFKGYSLELNENNSDSIPEYKIVSA